MFSAVNSVIGNMQKTLQKYVGFRGMDPEYCDRIEDLMDRAQAWPQDIEELYNKAEVHSINTSKGDAADVGVMSDNSNVTVFVFLESAELAYLGWGNSVQKANRLYNKHLSEEIKSHLINISNDYGMMKTLLISNYGRPSRIIGISLIICPREVNQLLIIERRSLVSTQQLLELYKDWSGCQGLLTSMELRWNPVYYPEVHSAV